MKILDQDIFVADSTSPEEKNFSVVARVLENSVMLNGKGNNSAKFDDQKAIEGLQEKGRRAALVKAMKSIFHNGLDSNSRQ